MVNFREAKREERNNLQIVRNLITRFPLGCVCYQVVFDGTGKICDYVIMGMNPLFEAISGLKKEDVLGKKITEALIHLKPQTIDRILQIGNEALSTKEKAVEVNVCIFHHAYRASFFYVSDDLLFGIYEDIQSPVYRRYFQRSIPQAVIARSISEKTVAPIDPPDWINLCKMQNGHWEEDDDPLKFFPETCDFHEQTDAVFRDSLTGLYDRLFAMETLKMYVEQKITPLSVVLGDINGLKMINEAGGYDAGDEILIKIAGILREQCHEKDIAARWSDDEFFLLFPYTTEEETRMILDRLQEALSEISEETGGSIMTFGYATSDADIRGAEELIREAEKWMYRKKMLVSQSYRGSILRMLLSALHEKSPETQEHSNRMADYCRWISEKLRLPDEMVNDLVLTAMLHDIGKIGINHKILRKPGPLFAQERREIEQHPEIGYRITQNIPELSRVSRYILAHHERWDGTGYPNKLRGEEIPLASRIIAVVDAYDVMISGRVYRPARSAEEALAELKRCSGTQFDPFVVNAFVDLIMERILHHDSVKTKSK